MISGVSRTIYGKQSSAPLLPGKCYSQGILPSTWKAPALRKASHHKQRARSGFYLKHLGPNKVTSVSAARAVDAPSPAFWSSEAFEGRAS